MFFSWRPISRKSRNWNNWIGNQNLFCPILLGLGARTWECRMAFGQKKKNSYENYIWRWSFFFPNWVTRISSQEIDSSLIQMDRAKGGFFSESTIRFSNLQRKIFQKSILNYAVSVSFTSALIQKNCCHLTIFLAISFPRTGTRKSINVFEVWLQKKSRIITLPVH